MYNHSGDCYECPKCNEIMESSGQLMYCPDCDCFVDPVRMALFEEWMLDQAVTD